MTLLLNHLSPGGLVGFANLAGTEIDCMSKTISVRFTVREFRKSMSDDTAPKFVLSHAFL